MIIVETSDGRIYKIAYDCMMVNTSTRGWFRYVEEEDGRRHPADKIELSANGMVVFHGGRETLRTTPIGALKGTKE